MSTWSTSILFCENSIGLLVISNATPKRDIIYKELSYEKEKKEG